MRKKYWKNTTKIKQTEKTYWLNLIKLMYIYLYLYNLHDYSRKITLSTHNKSNITEFTIGIWEVQNLTNFQKRAFQWLQHQNIHFGKEVRMRTTFIYLYNLSLMQSHTHTYIQYIYTYMCVHVCVRVYVCVDKECVCGHKNQYWIVVVIVWISFEALNWQLSCTYIHTVYISKHSSSDIKHSCPTNMTRFK